MILPLLAGLAEGAGKTYGDIAEKERANKMQNDRLVAGALLDKLKDPTLSPEDHDNLSRQYYKTLGMKGGDVEQIMQAHNYMRQAVQDHQSQFGPPPENSDDPGNSIAGPVPSGPGSQLGLPPIPQYAGRQTVGDLQNYQANKSALIGGAVKNRVDAAETAAKLHAQIDTADNELFARTGRHLTSEEIGRMVKAEPTFRPLPAGFVPGFVTGKDARLEAEVDSAGNPIEEDAVYRRSKDAGGNPTNTFSRTAARANGGEWINDVESNTGFSHIYRDNIQGNIIKVEKNVLPPSGYLQNQNSSTRKVFKTETQADGTITLVPVTETSETNSGKEIPGGVAPGQPAPKPGAGASGASQPHAPSITPSSPLPTPPAGLGTSVPVPQGPNPYGSNIRVGTVVGGKPLTDNEFKNLNNARQGLKALQKMQEAIDKDPNILIKAGIPGSVGARMFDTFRKEASDIITRLRTGAALNEEEQVFYQGQMPGLMDLIGQHFEPGLVKDKLKLYEDLYNGVVQQYGRRAVGGYKPGEFNVAPAPASTQTSSPTPSSAIPQQYKVGDPIVRNGKNYVVTKLDPKDPAHPFVKEAGK